MNELKNDDWILSLKNEKDRFGFGVRLKMDDPRHQKIYGLVVDEATKVLKKYGCLKKEEK